MPSRDYVRKLAEERFERRIRESYQKSLDGIAQGVDEQDLADRIRRGDIEGAVNKSGVNEEAFDGMRKPTEDAFKAGGDETVKTLPQQSREPFQPGSRRAASRVNIIHLRKIQDITVSTRHAIRGHIRDGLSQGDNPLTVARRIRGKYDYSARAYRGGVIGLTEGQERWVANAHRQLASGDPTELRKYLGRKLRDRRYDSAVLRAINDGEPLPDSIVTNATDHYRRKATAYRANTIARDQALGAVSGGQDAALDQMVDSEVLREEDILQVWVHSGDADVRDTHVQIPGMNKEGVRRGEYFETPLGPLLYPRDQNSPGSVPANTIQCRCTLLTKVRRRPKPKKEVDPEPEVAEEVVESTEEGFKWRDRPDGTTKIKKQEAAAYDLMTKNFDESPLDIKNIVNRTEIPRFEVGTGKDASGAFYQGGLVQKIVVGQKMKGSARRKDNTFVHEYGHHVDSVYAPAYEAHHGVTPGRMASSTGPMRKAFTADAKRIGRRSTLGSKYVKQSDYNPAESVYKVAPVATKEVKDAVLEARAVKAAAINERRDRARNRTEKSKASREYLDNEYRELGTTFDDVEGILAKDFGRKRSKPSAMTQADIDFHRDLVVGLQHRDNETMGELFDLLRKSTAKGGVVYDQGKGGQLADFFAAFTKNRVGFGHSDTYWNKAGNRNAEAFAQYWAARSDSNPAYRVIMEQFAPEFCREAGRFLDDIVAGSFGAGKKKLDLTSS